MIAVSLITLVLAAVGSAIPMSKRFPGEVITQCTVPGKAALTFDDGPFIYAYDVVNALNSANATGTFFFNGRNWGDCIYAEDQAPRVKYVYDHGHQVASHTWSHAHLNTLNWDQLHNEFWLVEEALSKITGAYPAFVRPPYGEYNGLVQEVARVRGQAIALWDFDSGDSWGITPGEVKQRYTDLVNSRPASVIALNHETIQWSAQDAVYHAIWSLKNAGYDLVSLADCVGQAPYQFVNAPQARDASWNCNVAVSTSIPSSTPPLVATSTPKETSEATLIDEFAPEPTVVSEPIPTTESAPVSELVSASELVSTSEPVPTSEAASISESAASFSESASISESTSTQI